MHDIVLHVESVFVVVEKLQLPLQVGDVGLQHGLNGRGGGSLSLHQLPLGFQHFVLLLQVSYLWHKQEPNQTDPNVFYRDRLSHWLLNISPKTNNVSKWTIGSIKMI